MIERRVFPPDVQSFFDLELEGDASLINRVKAIPGLYQCVSFSSVMRSSQTRVEKCREVSPT